MQITRNPAAMDLKIREAHEYLESLSPREPGLHVSDLISCRRRAWYKREGYHVADHSTQTLLLFMLGQGHHAMLQARRQERKLTKYLAGVPVTGSVDDIGEYDAGGEFPEEYKTTRAGSKKSPFPAMHYVEQVASYAWMMGSNFARIFAFHLLGDRGRAAQPEAICFDLSFAEGELDTWGWELERRAHAVVGTDPPSFAEHRNWECDYCPFNQKFGGPCAAEKSGTPDDKSNWFEVDSNLRIALEN